MLSSINSVYIFLFHLCTAAYTIRHLQIKVMITENVIYLMITNLLQYISQVLRVRDIFTLIFQSLTSINITIVVFS